MPQFKRPSRPPSPTTGGGFQRPAEPEKKPSAPLEKKGIDEEIRINDLHLNEELMGQPLLMRKYTKELASLRKKVKGIKNQLELKESALKIVLSNDGKGRKVAEIEAMTIADASVQELRVQLYDAEELEDEFEGIVKSIAQRMEALKDLCANVRKELM